ncbi:MAG: Lrp/AsnC ligand binding domain-containing protein [Acidobacteria bacterium]|nr:Lrp/AsnC ligand binding domain-containing protein [Acidobacteriota bacterium]
MVEAYIFLNIRPGWAKKIVREVAELPEVASIHACWGRPDIIAYVKVPDVRKLRELVLQRFHKVEGVEFTDTHIVVDL